MNMNDSLDQDFQEVIERAARCHGKTEVFSRVVGFYRPVQTWNGGKQAEFSERKPFKAQLQGS